MEEPFERIGKYWYEGPETKPNGEFDLMTVDPKGYVFYEATFRSEPLDERLILQEIALVQRRGLRCYKYGFISRSGFAVESAQNLELISLKQLYE